MTCIAVGTCASTGKPIELCYDTFGDPKDEPLLLVMGLGTQMVAWREEFCQRLAQLKYYVVRFDNRDVGLSTHLDEFPAPNMVLNYAWSYVGLKATCVYTLSDMARDAIGLLDALGLSAAHVVGASMGGMIAQVLALEHPQRVRSLCCIMSTSGEHDLPGPRWRAVWQLSKPMPEDREKAIELRLDTLGVICSPKYFDREALRPYVTAAYDRSAYRQGFTRQSAAVMAAPGRRRALATLTVPCLVIHGEADPLVPYTHGLDLARSLPNCTLLTPAHMAHDLPEAEWDMMIAAIDANARRAKAHPEHNTIASNEC
eukprot:EG_transcript_15185